jgi:hypothetical protein
LIPDERKFAGNNRFVVTREIAVGSFYANITLKGPQQTEIMDYLRSEKRSAAVSPTFNDLTVVYDEASESQDDKILFGLAEELSRQFQCLALAVLNHDDGVLWYELYEKGLKLHGYNSRPDYFDDTASINVRRGGNPEALCAAFNPNQGPEKIRAVLEREYLFEIDRHNELTQALNLAELAVGIGFNNLAQFTEADVSGVSLIKRV